MVIGYYPPGMHFVENCRHIRPDRPGSPARKQIIIMVGPFLGWLWSTGDQWLQTLVFFPCCWALVIGTIWDNYEKYIEVYYISIPNEPLDFFWGVPHSLTKLHVFVCRVSKTVSWELKGCLTPLLTHRIPLTYRYRKGYIYIYIDIYIYIYCLYIYIYTYCIYIYTYMDKPSQLGLLPYQTKTLSSATFELKHVSSREHMEGFKVQSILFKIN